MEGSIKEYCVTGPMYSNLRKKLPSLNVSDCFEIFKFPQLTNVLNDIVKKDERPCAYVGKVVQKNGNLEMMETNKENNEADDTHWEVVCEKEEEEEDFLEGNKENDDFFNKNEEEEEEDDWEMFAPIVHAPFREAA